MHETILLLKKQLESLSSTKSSRCPQQSVHDEIIPLTTCFDVSTDTKSRRKDGCYSYEETTVDENTPTSVISLDRVFTCEDSKECSSEAFLNSQLLMQVSFLLIYLLRFFLDWDHFI